MVFLISLVFVLLHFGLCVSCDVLLALLACRSTLAGKFVNSEFFFTETSRINNVNNVWFQRMFAFMYRCNYILYMCTYCSKALLILQLMVLMRTAVEWIPPRSSGKSALPQNRA